MLKRALDAPLPGGLTREIIVVDDGSTDGCDHIVQAAAERHPGIIRLFRHQRNLGKGAAIRTAVGNARGQYCLIQDADLEYDPNQYGRLLEPLLNGQADAVYGSRFMIVPGRRVLYHWAARGDRKITKVCNRIGDLDLTDAGTGYKAFRTAVLAETPLYSDGFAFEVEITIKLAKKGSRIVEVPVTYNRRAREEGRKLCRRDAFFMRLAAWRYAATGDLYKDSGARTLHALTAAPRFNQWMADTIRPWVGKRVLEIGSGIGNLTSVLIQGRDDYMATDVNPEHMGRLRQRLMHRTNLRQKYCDLTAAKDFASFQGQMDTVICLNVLEHVEDDHGGLANIFSALAPGGHAIVLVPEGQSVYGAIDEALGHVRRYSEEELSSKMKQAGFHLEHMLKFNRVSRPAWFVSGRIIKRDSLDWNQMRIYDRMVWLWRIIDRWLPWKPTSIIAIGRKP